MAGVTQLPVLPSSPFDFAKAEGQTLLNKFGNGEIDEFSVLAEADTIAKRHGVRATDFRGWVKAELAKLRAPTATDAGKPGSPPPPFATDPEPAADPWPLNTLLQIIVGVIQRRIYAPPEIAYACALWIAATWGLFPPSAPETGTDIFPRLHIFAAVMRCGKSLLLEIVMALSRRPLAATDISESALFRIVEKCRPTLGIDEADRLFAKNPVLTGIVNSGYCQSGGVVRSVEVQSKHGKEFDPRLFATYAPVAIAGIGRLPGTIEDRSIRLPLERQPRDAATQRVTHRQLVALRVALAPQLMAHADAIGAAMAQGVPDTALPATLNDRDADNWRPLLALADRAGGTWPARARQAAKALCQDAADTAGGNEAMLQAVLHYVDDQRRAACASYLGWVRAGRKGVRPTRCQFIQSAHLASALMDQDDCEVADARDHGVAKKRIAWRLRPFGVRPVLRRVTGQSQPTRGYEVGSLRVVWRQYRP